ncbi:MAG: PKD domain-containing protein, partial [Crocinitomicaceae bacterium]
VNPIPVVADPLDQVVCNNSQTADVFFSSLTAGTTFTWENDDTTIGLSSAGNGDILSFTATNTTNTPIVATITVIPSFENGGVSCVGDSVVFEIKVNPTLIVLVDSSASYCQNSSSVLPITTSSNGTSTSYIYQWYSNSNNTNVGGSLILGANSSTYLPPVNSIGIVYYYCVMSEDTSITDCSFTSNSVGITTNLGPTFSSQPISSQTVCVDGTLNSLSVAYQNGTGIPTFQWYSNTVNSTTGGIAINGANSSTYLPLSSVSGTTYYYCVATFASGGCDEIISDISAVVVQPDPAIVVQPIANQTICVGGTIASTLFISHSGGVGLATYQWQQGGISIFGATDSTFTPSTFALAGSYDYTVILTLSGSGCNVDTSAVANIQVVPDPIVTNQPISATYCQFATTVTPLSVSASGGLGTYNYQWYSNTVNSAIGGILINGATDSTFIPSVGVVGTVYYYCIITQSGVNCDVTSNACGIVTTQAPLIDFQPLSSQTLCIGGTPVSLSISYAGGNGTVSYQWYQSPINSNTGGTPIISANSSTFSPPTNTADSLFYYCVISFQIGGCSSVASATALVNVVNDPVIISQPILSQAICQGNTVVQPLNFIYSGGTGVTSITWYQVGTPNIVVNGINSTTFQPNPFNTAGTFNYYAEITSNGVGCDNLSTLASEIIVHPTPYVDNLNDTIICNNETVDINISSTVSSNFQWVALPNSNVSGELTTIQNTNLITDSLTNTTTSPEFVTYTITPTSFPFGCPGPDSLVVVQVQPDVVLAGQTNIEICSGSPVNAILAANIPANFNWFVTIDNPNVTGESLSPSTSNVINDYLTNNTLMNQVVVYSIFPISIDGSCDGLSQTIVVTVKPPLQLLNEDTLTICSGDNVNLALIANTNVTFNWYADQNPNVSGESTFVTSSALINDTLLNNSNTVQEVTYHVIGTSTGNGCSSPIIPVIVYVNPVPSVDPILDTLLCTGTNFNPISFTGAINGATYDWTTNNSNIGIPQQNGQNSTPGFIASNGGIFPEQSDFTVIPSFSSNNVTCVGANETFSISVLPVPTVNPLLDFEICNATQVPITFVSGNVPNTIFNWTNTNPSISLNASGIGDIPSFNASNLSNLDQVSTVTVSAMIQLGNVQCYGANEDFLITVHPTPHLLNTDIEICSGENTNILLNANIASSFEWQANPTLNVFNETSFPLQTSTLINDVLTITANTTQVVDYIATPISLPFGCIGPDSIITVSVHPLPFVDFEVVNPIICDQQLINFQNNSIGLLNYNWDFGDGNTSFLINTSNTYAAPGFYDVELTGVDAFTGCQNTSALTILVSETPNPNFILSDSVGCEVLDVLFTAQESNPNWNYSWDFGNGNSSQQFAFAGHLFDSVGCYNVSLTVESNDGCIASYTENNAICILENPIAAFTANNQIFSTLEPAYVQFTNASVFADNYYWQFGDYTNSIIENPNHEFFDVPNNFVVTLTASNHIGCQDTATMIISVIQDIALYVPNSFTPNGDENNQSFKAVLSSGFKPGAFQMLIFDRWGELVFESFDENAGWDGTYGAGPYGRECQIGTYTWKITAIVLATGETKLFVGHVNLIK